MQPSPWHTGRCLAITMAISYTVCALLYRLWPEQGIRFLNALFHGLDFGRLVTPAPFNLADYFMPLTVLVVWGFITGSVFGWVSRGLDCCCPPPGVRRAPSRQGVKTWLTSKTRYAA